MIPSSRLQDLNPNDDADASLIDQLLRRQSRLEAEADEQDARSKSEPLTMNEALWRVERALLRIAHALEAK